MNRIIGKHLPKMKIKNIYDALTNTKMGVDAGISCSPSEVFIFSKRKFLK